MQHLPTHEPLLIDTPAALADLCEQVADSPWLALDTEFMREKTYQPQLCLLQLGTPEWTACVDPLALADLDPLLDLLYEPARLKVFHAARQDLEIFYYLRGTLPAPVFDTQIAAAVLGHGDQVGYATLVRDALGVELDKSQARTDWARRPLEPEQLAYAADDVRFLAQLYPRIHEALARQDRLAWLTEDFTNLVDPADYANPPEEAWRRVSGVNRLNGQQLAVLQSLAGWREEQAKASNRPRRWVLRDEVLLEMARQMPDSPGKLERLRGVEPALVRRAGAAIVALVQAGRLVPKADWPVLAPRVRLSVEQEALVDGMMAVLRLCAAQHDVSAASLGTRAELEQIAAGRADVPLLQGWRGALAGRAVQALMAGELALQVRDGRLVPIERI